MTVGQVGHLPSTVYMSVMGL